MRQCVLALLVLCSLLSAITGRAEVPAFTEAQVAASEGRYEDVVSILSSVIKGGELAQEDLAIAYSNRGIAYSLLKEYGLSVEDLRKAIELNPEHLLTINHLGILAEHVERDFAKAARWYERAAQLGYPASRVNLGNLYRDGRGVSRDLNKAVALYQQASDSGYAPADVPLGELYLLGQGVQQDYEKGVQLLQRGVEEGVVTGHYHLGRAYEKGWGVERNYTAAMQHYQAAARQGHAPSQGAIGYLHRRGLGVTKDFVEAVRWYRLAAEQGDILAANRLAWLMATCPVSEVCNGRVAFEFASLAVATERSASNLDSLAAAHARMGEFEAALEIIDEILADQDLGPAARKKYARRIDRYRNGIPFQL